MRVSKMRLGLAAIEVVVVVVVVVRGADHPDVPVVSLSPHDTTRFVSHLALFLRCLVYFSSSVQRRESFDVVCADWTVRLHVVLMVMLMLEMWIDDILAANPLVLL